jgi:predicted site-specific integrase-resolvase
MYQICLCSASIVVKGALGHYKSMATARKLKAIATNTVVIYCRVSTDQQEKSGLGLEAQLDLCRQVAQQLNLEIIGEFSETIKITINYY